MASEARDEYLKALYALSKSDPSVWATYVEAFKTYTADELERITTASVDHAPIAIGSGRRMKELRDDCIDIEKTMDKYRK
jgi:DNA polymerase/3'-5' exonuclease PolX